MFAKKVEKECSVRVRIELRPNVDGTVISIGINKEKEFFVRARIQCSLNWDWTIVPTEKKKKREPFHRCVVWFSSEWNRITIPIAGKVKEKFIRSSSSHDRRFTRLRWEKTRICSSIRSLIHFGEISNGNLDREERKEKYFLLQFELNSICNAVKYQSQSRKKKIRIFHRFAVRFRAEWTRTAISIEKREQNMTFRLRSNRVQLWFRSNSWSDEERREKETFFIDSTFDLIRNEIEQEYRSGQESKTEFFIYVRFEFSSHCQRTVDPIKKREKNNFFHRFEVSFDSQWNRTRISIEKGEKKGIFASIRMELG